jgi:phosphoglucomutase
MEINELLNAYYDRPISSGVEFGTSGHRGSALKGTFNEPHILAIAQAIAEFRAKQKTTGPLYLGFDTHALSQPAYKSAIEVLSANGVALIINKNNEYTPTPVISRLILSHNQKGHQQPADGIVITPSHNGPQAGGIKYNPPNGGPADTTITKWIEERANQLLKDNNKGVKRSQENNAKQINFIDLFINDLEKVVELEVIKKAGLKIGADPLGGSGVHYWEPIAKKYGLNLTVVNKIIDPTFSFMPLDSDQTIRMDCSSPDAMAGLIALKDNYDIAFGNDPDFDRHGIVTPDGLMNPNHYLAVAIWYLLQNRPRWPTNLKIGKTVVSSSMIDKVVAGLGRELYEVPVGFKWFVPGLYEGWLAFGGEESAGASLLTKEGKVWTTDKDGFSLALLSAEILAKTGQTPSQIYNKVLVPKYGQPYYRRVDGPISDQQKAVLKSLTPDSITGSVAGQPIVKVITTAPGNNAPLGGLKVILADSSWFALRPSGTEPKMKLYIESWSGEDFWQKIYAEAPKLIF